MKVPFSRAAAGPLVDQGAAQAVQQQMFGALDDSFRDVAEAEPSDPGGQPAGRPGRIGGGLVVNRGRGHRGSSVEDVCHVV